MAENKKYFWFKLKEDFFLSKEIKIIRKMPSGAEILIVLFKLQLQALKTGGIIEIDGLCGTVEDELSVLIDEDTNLIKLALITLERFSLLNQINGTDIQMLLHKELIGQETASTIRSRKSRGNKKLENKEEEKTLLCNTTATNCNTDIDIELEKEKEINKEKDIKTSSTEIENFFEECWKLYPSKTGKGTIKDKAKKETYKLGEEFKRCIERYIEFVEQKRKKDFPNLNWKNGSTFWNSGYIDFLDENYKNINTVKSREQLNKESEAEYGF